MTTIDQGTVHRSRFWQLVMIIGVIAAGLASRRFPGVLPSVFGKYPGDVLWALMVYFGWGLVCSKATISKITGLTAATCLAIEFLKLYQATWLVQVRHTTFGHLIFGHVFSWQNLAAYSFGVILGVCVEFFGPLKNKKARAQ